MVTVNLKKQGELDAAKIAELQAQIKNIKSTSGKFGTWKSERTGNTFLKVKLKSASRDMLMSRDMYNELAEMFDEVCQAIEDYDID